MNMMLTETDSAETDDLRPGFCCKRSGSRRCWWRLLWNVVLKPCSSAVFSVIVIFTYYRVITSIVFGKMLTN